MNSFRETRTKKVAWIFMFIILAIIVLIFSVTKTMTDYRRLPTLISAKDELSIRGHVISSDKFNISASKKIYKATIDTRCLDPKKKNIFIKLFSIYSGIDEQKIRKRINNAKKPGTLVLSYSIDSRTAKNLKELAYKLMRLDVFQSINVRGGKILYGLDIVESGEKRVYPYNNTLTPVVGYIRKFESKDGTTKVRGIKGLEHQYNDLLNSYKDGLLKGERDVLSDISFNKNSVIKPKQDGANLVLNISLKLQKNIEMILDKAKEDLLADELIATIMDSKTGKIYAMASSNRFNPDYIHQEQIPWLNVNAIEMQFEPGSVLKPISVALVMEKQRLKMDELLFAYNKGKTNSRGEYKRGMYKIGRYRLRDDHQFKKNYLTIDDVIVYSSNVGTLQLAQRLSGDEFVEGLESFGITKKTGIDLPFEKVGRLPPRYRFRAGEDKGKDNIFKATVSYGQGMLSTYMQILKAYTVFNNDGFMVTPQVVDYLEDQNGKQLKIPTDEPTQIISAKTAREMKRMLIKTVKTGTGTSTDIEGLEIGGKTGTAQIARGGKYQKEYISSFFGFANDKDKRYTIGVTAFNPVGRKWWHHYASYAAARPFKDIVETMVSLGYLQKEE